MEAVGALTRPRASARYWCHQCLRAFYLGPGSPLGCPFCDGDFVEEMSTTQDPEEEGAPPRHPQSHSQMVEAMHALVTHLYGRPRHHHHHHHHSTATAAANDIPAEHMLFLRGLMDVDGGVELFMSRMGARGGGGGVGGRHNHRMSMDNGMGGYSLDQVVEHLTRNASPAASCGPPPASRGAVEALPTVRIAAKHLRAGHNTCAVCTEDFEIGGEAREMPCKHVYHAECLLPWLQQHNSCPICRHELPTDDNDYDQRRAGGATSDGSPSEVGLTIWGLPGGGFAVGRFPGPPPNVVPASSSSSSSRGQSRRSLLSYIWPFRSSSTSAAPSASASSSFRR